MINITGTSKITKIEEKGNHYVAVLYNSFKKFGSQTEYETEFINCRIVGEAAKAIKNVKNKEKIYIEEGCLRMEKNKYPVITIFKCYKQDQELGYME